MYSNVCKPFNISTSRNILTYRRCLSQILKRHASQHYSMPPTSDDLPRSAGIMSMFRLPVVDETNGLDVCFVGVPMDIGTSNRSGCRFGPRQIREMSSHVENYNISTGAAPYETLKVADAGDIYINQYNLIKSVEGIRNSFEKIVQSGCIPITVGGDHTISYPILQAIKDKHGSVGLIHIDAHDDTADTLSGEKITHGTTFRRAGEDGCLDMNRVIQIGLRGSGYGPNDYNYGTEHGFRIIMAEDCWYKSLTPLMTEVRQQMGTHHPVYISFDIDAIDPAYCPGTGTPVIGGLTVIQALEIIRGCRGLNIVGCDLVEVCPPYDMHGVTGLTAASLIFEMLCVLPGVRYHDHSSRKSSN